MRREDRILFAVTRQELLGAHREAVAALAREGPADWQGVADTAERHGVAPVVGHQLRSCGAPLPAEVAERFERALCENVLIQARESERLAAGISRLREAGYQVMLLKGAALERLVYGEPWLTVSKDADLLLRPEPGRSLAADEREVRRSLYRSGIECDVPRHHDLDMNGALPVRYDRIWAAARPVEVGEAQAFVMAPEDLLLSLCVNSCRKRFFRLKHLFDLAETTHRLPLDWRRLATRAREDRCEGIVYAALRVADATLGARLPPGALQALGVPRPRALALERLAERMLRRGSLAALDAPSSLLLPYASFRLGQALRSLRFALTFQAPAHHRPPRGAAPAGVR